MEDLAEMEVKVMSVLSYDLYHREMELYSDRLHRFNNTAGEEDRYKKYLGDIHAMRDSGSYWGETNYLILSQL